MYTLLARFFLLALLCSRAAYGMSCAGDMRNLSVTLDQQWQITNADAQMMTAVAKSTAGLDKRDPVLIAFWSATGGVDGYTLPRFGFGTPLEPDLHLAPTGARLTSAVPHHHNGEPEILAGDDAGFIHRIKLERTSHELIHEGVAIFPDANHDLTIIGEEGRARISPRGRDDGHTTVDLSGNIENLRLHRTKDNASWLAVQTATSINVFEVTGAGAKQIDSFPRRVDGPTAFDWLVDDKGQSLVVYRDQSDLHFAYPGHPERSAKVQVPGLADARFSTLHTEDQRAYVLLHWPEGRNELFAWSRGELTRANRFQTARGEPVDMLDLADVGVYGIYPDQDSAALLIRDITQRDTGRPLYRLNLKENERFKVARSLKLGDDDHRVAIQTTKNFYLLRVTSGETHSP